MTSSFPDHYSLSPDLINPYCLQGPISLLDFDKPKLIGFLQQMLLIRLVEQQLAIARRDSIIKGPVHLGVGQEAVAVGVSSSIKSTDHIFGAHRSHSHLLALGSSVYRLFAEVLAKPTGLSRGMGGSMHLCDPSVGFQGSVPIVAGTVPLAAGAAIACRLRASNNISVAYLGDGACEEGVVHEALNLASVQKDPILFVVENNFFSSHMHISLRQSFNSTARFACSNGIRSCVVDGNDVVKVARASQLLVDYIRDGSGPAFLEAITFRWLGHVDWRDDIDVGVQRSKEELSNWRKRDPVNRLKLAMFDHGLISESDFIDLENSLISTVSFAWNRAINDPDHTGANLLNHVYSND
jgi:TPP-dependent pyruvate/acetoin dehydrogenase alpha subunit